VIYFILMILWFVELVFLKNKSYNVYVGTYIKRTLHIYMLSPSYKYDELFDVLCESV